jgi:CRP-like cAMP-binding protein
MPNPNVTPRPLENQILALLPAEEYQRLRSSLVPVDLPQGQILYEAGATFEHVYFIDRGMISVVSIMEDGSSIEVGTIGNEGLGGLSVILGVNQLPYRHIMQVAGRARRMSVSALTAELKHDRPLRQLLYRYHAAFITQVMQGTACNGLHSIGQRCCRWLLTTQDRVGSHELEITHEFLAQMLGVRRATVSDVLRPLQDEGLIQARRGKVTILDTERLAAASCECYHVIRGEYQRLLG